MSLENSQPQLTIIDAYLCQEGDGPNDGDVVKLDLILAGYDPVALSCVYAASETNQLACLILAQNKSLSPEEKK